MATEVIKNRFEGRAVRDPDIAADFERSRIEVNKLLSEIQGGVRKAVLAVLSYAYAKVKAGADPHDVLINALKGIDGDWYAQSCDGGERGLFRRTWAKATTFAERPIDGGMFILFKLKFSLSDEETKRFLLNLAKQFRNVPASNAQQDIEDMAIDIWKAMNEDERAEMRGIFVPITDIRAAIDLLIKTGDKALSPANA